jgi:predicted  nucleic acid-binding Zn-ribbon protein
VTLDLDNLRAERDRAKDSLRELEVDSRKLESEIKALRQREVQTKREIDALNALIEIAESRSPADKA